jgi:hypothetical protein
VDCKSFLNQGRQGCLKQVLACRVQALEVLQGKLQEELTPVRSWPGNGEEGQGILPLAVSQKEQALGAQPVFQGGRGEVGQGTAGVDSQVLQELELLRGGEEELQGKRCQEDCLLAGKNPGAPAFALVGALPGRQRGRKKKLLPASSSPGPGTALGNA